MAELLELKLKKPNQLEINSDPRAQTSDTDTNVESERSERPKTPGRVPSGSQTPGSRSQQSSTETGDEAIPKKLNKGMSSLKTVLTVAGLLCVGCMFIMSGIILLATEHDAAKKDLFYTGAAFLALGFFMLIVCAVLQRKNFCRNVDKLEDELFGRFRQF